MPPKVNGLSLQDLVKTEVHKAVKHHAGEIQEIKSLMQAELDTAHQLLLGALARIACLEEKHNKVNLSTSPSSSVFSSPHSKSSSICRHFLQNRCSYGSDCKFSHEGRKRESSFNSAVSDLISFTESDKQQQSSELDQASLQPADKALSLNKVHLPNIKNTLLPCGASSQVQFSPDASQPTSPAPSPAPPSTPSSSSSADTQASKTSSKTPPEDVAWLNKMLNKVTALEGKYANQFSPWKDEGGVTHSAKVWTPTLDFSQIKPGLLRTLPKPDKFPLYGCSPESDFYHKCIDTIHGRRPKFECEMPFGSTAAFQTNLGIISVPADPIGGFVYKSGYGDSTVYQLHAQQSFL